MGPPGAGVGVWTELVEDVEDVAHREGSGGGFEDTHLGGDVQFRSFAIHAHPVYQKSLAKGGPRRVRGYCPLLVTIVDPAPRGSLATVTAPVVAISARW